MTKLVWDKSGERFFETGVDHGVLYTPNASGVYNMGYAWNGLTTVTESPSGAEASPQYADNIKYLNLVGIEEFGGTIECFTYPKEFEAYDGAAQPETGVYVTGQSRKTFGFSYRTKIGNDQNSDLAYKLHLVYGAIVTPSEKARSTVNDTPEAVTFSYEFTTTPVEVGTIGGTTYKPTAHIIIDSRLTNASKLADLETILYGTTGVDPRMPLPAEVVSTIATTLTQVTPTAPTYNSTTKVITIPTVTGVEYRINDTVVTGDVTITADTVVTANPLPGYKFPAVVDVDWFYSYT